MLQRTPRPPHSTRVDARSRPHDFSAGGGFLPSIHYCSGPFSLPTSLPACASLYGGLPALSKPQHGHPTSVDKELEGLNAVQRAAKRFFEVLPPSFNILHPSGPYPLHRVAKFPSTEERIAQFEQDEDDQRLKVRQAEIMLRTKLQAEFTAELRQLSLLERQTLHPKKDLSATLCGVRDELKKVRSFLVGRGATCHLSPLRHRVPLQCSTDRKQ